MAGAGNDAYGGAGAVRPRFSRWALPAGLVAILTLLPVAIAGPAYVPPAVASPTDPALWACNAETLGLDDVSLQLAPVSPQEREQDGSSIQPHAGPDGSWVPVILIHGWTARANHPDTDGDPGTFSHLIDLTRRLGVPSPDVPRSMVGQLQGLPGAAVFTYDYHPYSGRWVTDRHIGPGLAAAIQCLGRESGNKAVVIGHSMGGLAIRQALAEAGVAEHVSAAVTVGTPHSGSLAALAVARALQPQQRIPGTIPTGTQQLFSMLITYCGEVSTEDFTAGGVCGALSGPLRAFDGEAGQALRAGSAELQALPPIPSDVPFYPMAGRATLEIPGSGWFGFVGQTETIDIGDVIVTTGSALSDIPSESAYDISCAYRLGALPELGQTFRLVLGTLDPEDQNEHALHAVGGACFHTGLFRGIEITNEVMLVTLEHIEEQTRLSEFVVEDGTGVVRGVAFVSPSGNILCEFSHGGEWNSATCWIGDKDFTVPQSELEGGCYGPEDPPPADSDEVALHTYGGTPEVAWANCRHETPHVGYETADMIGRWAPESAVWLESEALFPVTVPVLEYGQSLRAGNLTCSSASSGVTCRAGNGTGFTLSRHGLTRH